MMFKPRVLIMLAMLLMAVVPALAQTPPDRNANISWLSQRMALASVQIVLPQTPPDPNASISWPPPVYVVRGVFEIRGSANLPGMSNYFLEFRPLGVDLQPLPGADSWFPALLPSAAVVNNDILGGWDTRTVADGIYELRLSVNAAGSPPVTHVVSPIRIENAPPPFAATPTPPPTATLAAPPTPVPTPSPTFDATPRVTITTPQGNLREGDSTVFRIIVTLPTGTTARIRGVSNRGTGWYYVQLDDGRLGWMSPEIVQTSGSLTGLPQIAPPPLPAPTPPPAPVVVPTVMPVAPISNANLVAGVVVLDPGQPVCARTFIVGFDVANLGSERTAASGTISLVNVRAADGSQQGSTVGGFPVIEPGQTFRVTMPLTISTFYNETHRITLVIDPGNQIPENNKTDNTRTIEYTLQRGDCP